MCHQKIVTLEEPNKSTHSSLHPQVEVLDNVSGMMQKVLDNALPDMTGPTVPKYIQPKK